MIPMTQGLRARQECTPLVLETYRCWVAEAYDTYLGISMRCTKSQVTASINGRLAKYCARALLSGAGPSLVITG